VRNFKFDSQISYRAGITYEVLPRVNAYASLSQSFSPQLNNSIDANGVTSPLPQLEGQQYETGVKYRSSDGRFLATGSLFDIKQKNQGQFDQFKNGTNYFKAIGEVTHKGFELEAVGQITSQWQVNAAYAYLNAKVTKDSATLRVGQRRTFLPDQTWSLFTTYALPDGMLQGLTIGAGVRHVSSEHTAFLNAAGVRPTKDIPGYTLVDATVSYAIDKWLVQVNARNIFDKYYLINNYQTLTFGNVVGTPANVTLTIRREF
jgi:iron complex outermembrane receptor protein